MVAEWQVEVALALMVLLRVVTGVVTRLVVSAIEELRRVVRILEVERDEERPEVAQEKTHST